MKEQGGKPVPAASGLCFLCVHLSFFCLKLDPEQYEEVA